MAMYDAQGSKLYIGNSGSPDASDQVLQIRRISDPSPTRSWRDRTDLDVNADTGGRTGKPGLLDIGEFSIEVFQDGDVGQQHDVLVNALLNNTKKNFKITWPDGRQMVFDGYVMSFTGSEEVDGDLVRTYNFRGIGMPAMGGA